MILADLQNIYCKVLSVGTCTDDNNVPLFPGIVDLLMQPFQRQTPIRDDDGKYVSLTFYHNNHPVTGAPDGLPHRDELFLLMDSSGEAPVPFHRLIVWAGVRYVLLLEPNDTTKSCEENAALDKLHKATRSMIVDAIGAAREECMQLFWPFLMEVSPSRHKAARGSFEAGSSGLKQICTVNIKLATINGSLVAVSHSKPLDNYGEPMKNPYPDVPTFKQSQIKEVQKIHDFISKVKVDDDECCFKRYRHSNELSFLQEVSALRAGKDNPNVMELSGLVESSDGFVIGFLMPFMSGLPLEHVKSASDEEKQAWKTQILNTVQYLHARDVLWEDVKPGNVLISKSGQPCLLDFEGGACTVPYYSFELRGTKEGDMYAIERLFDFIDKIPSKAEVAGH